MTDPTPSPHADDGPDARQRERHRGDLLRAERALRHGAVALLLAILALGAALFALWRTLDTERTLEARHAALLDARDHELVASALTRARDPAVADALARLEPLASRVAALDERLARTEARLEAPERAVARVEAAHLVELATRRLELEQDVTGAALLFEAADARLATRGDAGALRIRAQLAHDLAALRATAQPDLRAIGARLAGAEATVRELPMLGAIRGQYLPPGAGDGGSGAARAWQRLTTSLQDLVSVRRVSDASVRLVSVEEIGVRRRHLQTLLFAARLAALRADQVEYAADLAEARDWLARYFDPADGRTRVVAAELEALGANRVAVPLPDVSGSARLLRATPP
jgi:uroporphyrin-3 C-methyltransferase